MTSKVVLHYNQQSSCLTATNTTSFRVFLTTNNGAKKKLLSVQTNVVSKGVVFSVNNKKCTDKTTPANLISNVFLTIVTKKILSQIHT